MLAVSEQHDPALPGQQRRGQDAVAVAVEPGRVRHQLARPGTGAGAAEVVPVAPRGSGSCGEAYKDDMIASTV